MLIPKNRHEYYLAVISGNDYPTFPPKIREEQYLAKLAGHEVDVPNPKTPKERAYYNIINDIKFEPENRWQTFVAAANDDSITSPVPITREEIWWANISLSHEVIVEYVGTLPTTLQTVEGYLESYKIYGNTVQAGTPTPGTPMMPEGVGEKTVNLYNINAKDENNGYINNAQLTQDGTVATWGTAEISEYIPISGDTAYTFNGIGSYNSPCYALYDESKQLIGAYRYNGRSIINFTSASNARYFRFTHIKTYPRTMMVEGTYTSSTMPEYEPYGYKLPIFSNSAATDIYIGDKSLVKDEYVDSTTGKIYRRTENLSPPEEEWMDEWIWGDGTIHPSTEIKTSPFIDVSTCETCIMEVFFTEDEWAEAGYREMAFYDENKQYLGWIGGGGRQTLTPNPSENLSEFPAGTVYVRIGCSHGNQPFYPQLVSGYTPVHQFYPYHVPTDPPAPFPQIPTVAGTTVIDYTGTPKPDKVDLTYKTVERAYISADDEVYQDPIGQLLGG